MAYIYGIHAVVALLKNSPSKAEQIYVFDKHTQKSSPVYREILELIQGNNLSYSVANKKELDKLAAGGNHQGIVIKTRMGELQTSTKQAELSEQALIEWVRYSTGQLPEDELITEDFPQDRKQPVLILILDGVEDPHNLGACMRSAEALGAMAVVIPKHGSVKNTAVVTKVASGAAEVLPLVVVTNLASFIEKIKEAGVWIVGASHEASQQVYEYDFKGPVGIILGGEGKGLRRLTQEMCDNLVKIPMLGTVSSLNVSVAAGITLYEAQRQRLSKK